jgi:hypothetical protein
MMVRLCRVYVDDEIKCRNEVVQNDASRFHISISTMYLSIVQINAHTQQSHSQQSSQQQQHLRRISSQRVVNSTFETHRQQPRPIPAKKPLMPPFCSGGGYDCCCCIYQSVEQSAHLHHLLELYTVSNRSKGIYSLLVVLATLTSKISLTGVSSLSVVSAWSPQLRLLAILLTNWLLSGSTCRQNKSSKMAQTHQILQSTLG